MALRDINEIPFMLYADGEGRVYDHPYYRMVGFSGMSPQRVEKADLISVPEFSKLFYIPECPPMGLDLATGEVQVVREVGAGGRSKKCYGVASFLEAGLVRTLLPAVDYRSKSYTLPTWAYTATGYKGGEYWAAGFRIEDNSKWDPRNYDDRDVVKAIRSYERRHASGPLIRHLMECATGNHCFAAKNLFLSRWEAPIPVSRGCNSKCLGCLSLQSGASCMSSHQRIRFKPSKEEIVSLAVNHLEQAPEGIISFGQGCEGEPLTEYKLIADSIQEIRMRTDRGTINLNTNGSWPERIRVIAERGLDSIRISLNSGRPEFYHAYYRPKGYGFRDVVASVTLSRELGLYTMINYLVFPGVTDQEEEVSALMELIRKTGLNFLHLKNLCIDPRLYLEKMPRTQSPAVGMRKTVAILQKEFPHLELGYFNKAVR